MSDAFQAAIAEWNAFSSTTKVEFDIAPPGQGSNIQIQSTTDSSGSTLGCAAYKASTGRIYFGETFIQALNNPGVGTTIFAHELGHALGLIDAGTNPSNPTIMNNPSNSLPYACTNPNVATTAPLPSDASAIPNCTQRAQSKMESLGQAYSINQSNGFSVPFQTCTYTYYTEYYYVNGEAQGSEEYLGGVYCTQ